MPLLIGTWRFFVGGPELQLAISDLQPNGRFGVEASTQLAVQVGSPNPFLMLGEGFWDEIGQAVSFTLGGTTAGATPPTVTLMFSGHQVSPATTGDPAQDQVWTLVGEFRHALFAGGAPTPLIPGESARRTAFGWYAQITAPI
jgi:hypothetical protein